MAEVYSAMAPDGSCVALKALREHNMYDPEFLLMFVDEANLMAELDHPNVVKVHDASYAETDGFFTMEYVRGATLLQALGAGVRKHGAARRDLAVSVALRAAAGVHHAHGLRNRAGKLRGVVHRDLSMSNILIGFDGSVKVADFGVALASDRELSTGENVIKGKIGYMSPEQCLGKPLDRRSDVFTLGILLYETTLGKRLFGGKSDYERLTRLVNGEVQPPSHVDTEYPKDLEKVVMRALAKEPADRYQTALELLVDLGSVQSGKLSVTTDQLGATMRFLFPDQVAALSEDDSVMCEVHSSVVIEFVAAEPDSDFSLDIEFEPDTQVMERPPEFGRCARGSGDWFSGVRALGTHPPAPLAADDFLLEEANRRLSAGRYKAALGAFSDILERRPGDLSARAGMYMAQAYLARVNGREQVASRYLRMAADIAPAHTAPPVGGAGFGSWA